MLLDEHVSGLHVGKKAHRSLPAPNWLKKPLTLWLKLLLSKKSARPASFAALLQQEMMSIQSSAVKKYLCCNVLDHWTAKLRPLHVRVE